MRREKRKQATDKTIVFWNWRGRSVGWKKPVSRSKNGVAEFTLGLAEGKTRGLAYVPGIHVFPDLKQDVDGRDKPGHDGEKFYGA